MIIEAEFFFHGMPRWNLGWATPNYAGAFLATLIPWCWLWRQQWMSIRHRLASVAVIALEAGGWFLLCKTYSRGALIAGAMAVLWWSAARWWSDREKVKPILSEAGVRFAAMALLLVITGFIGRITPGYTQSDASIGNRLDLWRGGLEMIASSPWTGWGAGESGRAYMNWFQPVGSTDVFTTMVNSYLHVAVEHGLLVFAAAFAIFLALVIAAWRTASRGDALAGIAGASLLAWAVANIFTTLWIEPRLWILPGVAIVVIVWRVYRSLPTWRWVSSAAFGIGVAAAVSVLFYAVGAGSSQRHAWKVMPRDDESTTLVSRTGSGEEADVWHVWPDKAIFGPTPGQELRRWIATHALEVHAYRPADRKLNEYGMEGGLVLSGNQVERLRQESIPSGIRRLWLVHPSSPPPPARNSSIQVVVVLPAIDETGLNSAWRTWAQHTNARVIVSGNSGLDLRAVWPGMAPQGTST